MHSLYTDAAVVPNAYRLFPHTGSEIFFYSPIDSAGVNISSMITVRGKQLLSSPYLYGRTVGLASFLCQAQTFFSGRVAEGLRS